MKMKRLVFPLLTLLMAVLLTSCEDYETYGDMKAQERDAIDRYITQQNIRVISESQFKAQGETTNLNDNEYVRLERSGVYMQIVRKGCGSQLEDNKLVNILCRFREYNIKADTMLIFNDHQAAMYDKSLGTTIDVSQFVDKMSVTRSGTTFTASFVTGMMMRYHGSTSVPAGWLVPLNFVNIGRPESANDEIAKVRLIVPHSQGTADATSSVYPCYYEITYVREK